MRGSKAYKAAGVDTEAGASLVDRIKPLVRSTARAGSNPDLGGFGGLFDLKACGFKDPVLVAANDGVGTKLKVAIEAGIHNSVGIDLVAMCVNDLIVQGAEPLFFLDYFASGRLDIDAATDVIAGIAKGCEMAGCALIGGETAEMPGMYADGDYDLAGFCVGAVERADVLPKRTMVVGDVVLGLPSAGFHSNGYSLIRKVVDDNGWSYQEPAPFDPSRTLGQVLLTPTRIYVPSVLAAIRATGAIKGLAHVTGGGLIENLPRMLPDGLAAELDLSKLPQPAEMDWLCEAAKLSAQDRLATFNCGVGMVLICAVDDEKAVMTAFQAAGEQPFKIGELVARAGDPVSFSALPSTW